MGGAPQASGLSPLKRAILELREMRSRLEEAERLRTEPVAIIGLGCRLPGGVDGPEAFWRLLHDGVDATTGIPPERWDVEACYDPDPEAPGKMYTRRGGFLEAVDRFDAHFFGVSPREALSMDPQQRLLLEVSWEALEDAGQAADKLGGSPTGVFMGVGLNDYLQLQLKSGDVTEIDAYLGSGCSPSVASGRLSYVLGLQGPSVSVDTACSSSLVAVHLACQSLRSGECRMALAGGVNLLLIPEISINLCKARMLAADGRCKTFDAAADGYVRSEGCGVVVLKRLSDALADGDRVLALIRGSAVNQDGRSGGLTVPNGPAQEALIRRALANARVEPPRVSYVEAHGTGTSLGDPIEVQALAAALRDGRPLDRALAIGSVKTNVGHLEAAAGVAGLIKVVLAFQHEEIPPHLHLKTPNPLIPWGRLPVFVPTRPTPWRSTGDRRIAGVSSFGFSGTNAHVVVEEAPAPPSAPARAERPLHLLSLSAKSEAALGELIARFERHLSTHPSQPLADVCFTANAGRAHFAHRVALIAASHEEARGKLAVLAAGLQPAGVTQTPEMAHEVVFLFTGQGSQFPGMGRRLYETQPTFRRALDRCAELLRPHLDRPLLSVLHERPGAGAALEETAYAQPALFALQYALSELWRSWGVVPSVVMGHSLGEAAAACVAGVFGLEDALKLVAARGRLMQAASADGGMAAVFAEEARVRAAVARRAEAVDIAAVNGPENVVVSGARPALEAVLGELAAQGFEVRRLRAARAFHSPMVEPMLAEFERIATEVSYRSPRLGLVSNLTGRFAEGSEVSNAGYWRRQARQAVRFSAGIRALHEDGHRLFLEVGPGATLLGLARSCVPEGAGVWLPSLRKGRDDWEQMLESLGALYVRGVQVDWAGFDRDYPRRRVALPTYPFERQRYWAGGQDLPRNRDPRLWEDILASGRRQSREAPLDLALPSYPAKWLCLDRLATQQMASALRRLGAYSRAGDEHSLEGLLSRFHVLEAHRNLLARWLRKLESQGVLQRRGEGFVSVHALAETVSESLSLEARELFREDPFLLDYIEHCGRRLVEVLTGRESPLETLFPRGSFALAEGLYERAALARYLNGIARALLQTVARTTEPGKSLRVLEVGAGTGGTTSALLPVLPPRQCVYWYTDVSSLFLARAEERFKDYPFLRYSLLDLEKDPQAQGFPRHAFDVVVGANVFHAAREIGEALSHALSLLAPAGLLLISEVTEHHAWLDVSVGLIEGWQRFGDGLRGDSPLLSRPQWEEALKSRGFDEVAAFPDGGSPPEVLGYHVLVARSPSQQVSRPQGPVELAAAPASPPPGARREPSRGSGEEVRRRLEEARPSEGLEMLVSFVRDEVMGVLRLDPARAPGRRDRLMDLGVDSLMALELRSRLGAGLGLPRALPATLILDCPTVQAIATYLAKDVLALVDAAPSSGRGLPERGGSMDSAARMEELSEGEVESLLIQKLDSLERELG